MDKKSNKCFIPNNETTIPTLLISESDYWWHSSEPFQALRIDWYRNANQSKPKMRLFRRSLSNTLLSPLVIRAHLHVGSISNEHMCLYTLASDYTPVHSSSPTFSRDKEHKLEHARLLIDG